MYHVTFPDGQTEERLRRHAEAVGALFDVQSELLRSALEHSPNTNLVERIEQLAGPAVAAHIQAEFGGKVCYVEPLSDAMPGPSEVAPERLRTPAEARQWMDEQGLSQAELARRFHASPSLVDAILRGNKPCRRGVSHNIAVFLGLKIGQTVSKKQRTRRRAAATQEVRP